MDSRFLQNANSWRHSWDPLVLALHIVAKVECSCLYLFDAQGVHYSSNVNIHKRAQKGYYLEQACTKCMYKRHITIKHEVDIHEVGDKAIEKYL